MANVNQDDIDTLVAVSGHQVTADQATRVLKISSNNVETAMNKIFDALERPNGITELLKQGDTTWDGTAFGGLSGYGAYQDATTNTNLPTFHIDATNVDDTNNGGYSAAPTRPPSRSSQRPGSAMSTHMGDVPMQSSFYSEDGSWNNIEPLTGFSGVENSQESGIVGNGGTAGVLRPATQNYYDSASWALVPATKSTEYIPDAALDGQIRKEKPGFIKPTVGDNHLPALITILHSVPHIRNTLLAQELQAANYWRGEDWWKGTSSTTSIFVNDDTGSESGSELEFLYEVQRLMAFLDSSDRSYASLESLLQLDAWAHPRFSAPDEPTHNDLLKFLMRWSWMYQKHAPAAQIDGVFCSEVNVNGKSQGSHVLEIEMNTTAANLTEPTLYDYIDELLFTEFGSAHIIKPSSVLVLSLQPGGLKRNCKVPAVLHADRYLEENRGAVEANFNEKKKYKELLTTLEANVESFKYHTPQKVHYPKKMETLTLLKDSMRAFESDTEAMTESPRDVAVLARLQALHDNIEKKLADLEEQQKKAKEALEGIAELFRAPLERPDSDTDTPQAQHKYNHPYWLCGIGKSKTEYYVCRPIEDAEDSEKDHAWWHIQYTLPSSTSSTDEYATVIREQKDIADVLKDLSEISENTVLVYANETALAPSPAPLTAKLETFVKKDNLNFQQEVEKAQAVWYEDEQNQGDGAVAEWMQGDNGWDQGFNAANLSSKTLTPDTDHDPPAYRDEDDVVNITLSPERETEQPMEMQEINGGISAWAGASNASSETVELEPMSDVVASDGRESRAKHRAEDTLMTDAETSREAKAEHIEVVEKKGG